MRNTEIKGSRPARPTRLRESDYAQLAARVTERDRQIAIDCYEHHVLTTGQIQRLHFAGPRTARARLQELYALRVLDRFRPLRARIEGTMPYHWVADEAGAQLVADHRGIERDALRYQHADGLKLAASRTLTHHVEANEFFVSLAVEAAGTGGALAQWYGVRTLAHLFAGIVIPDGYGVLATPGRATLHILLEHDRGSETAQIIKDKARRYAETLPRSSLRDHDPLVIFTAGSARRAQTLTNAVAHTTVPIAVITWNAASRRPLLPAITAAANHRFSALALCPKRFRES
jgi:Replication-relaxation